MPSVTHTGRHSNGPNPATRVQAARDRPPQIDRRSIAALSNIFTIWVYPSQWTFPRFVFLSSESFGFASSFEPNKDPGGGGHDDTEVGQPPWVAKRQGRVSQRGRRTSPDESAVSVFSAMRPRPNSRVINRHLAVERATPYISPVGCPLRAHRNPAKPQGWPHDSLRKTLSIKSVSCLTNNRIRLVLGWSLPNGGR
jgi:hypothetical protein